MESKNSLPLRSTKSNLPSFFDDLSMNDSANDKNCKRFWKNNGTPFSVKDEPGTNSGLLYLI